MSLTDELTPPAGDCGVGVADVVGRVLAVDVDVADRPVLAAPRSRRTARLVDAMPSGRYSTSSDRSSQGLPAAAATASAAAVSPKLV